jgi:hypothetical protein
VIAKIKMDNEIMNKLLAALKNPFLFRKKQMIKIHNMVRVTKKSTVYMIGKKRFNAITANINPMKKNKKMFSIFD